jgi:hypothetical protein
VKAAAAATNPNKQTGSRRKVTKSVRTMNFPVPMFCLDHRFVRPNYAQRPMTFPYSEADIEGSFRPPPTVRYSS